MAVLRGEINEGSGFRGDIIFDDEQVRGNLHGVRDPPLWIGTPPSVEEGVIFGSDLAEDLDVESAALQGGEPICGDERKVRDGGHDYTAKVRRNLRVGRCGQPEGIGIVAAGAVEKFVVGLVEFSELVPTWCILRIEFGQTGRGGIEGSFGECVADSDEAGGDAEPVFGGGEFDGGRDEGGKFAAGGVAENTGPGSESLEGGGGFRVFRKEGLHGQTEGWRKNGSGLTGQRGADGAGGTAGGNNDESVTEVRWGIHPAGQEVRRDLGGKRVRAGKEDGWFQEMGSLADGGSLDEDGGCHRKRGMSLEFDT